ncbi:MAG: IS4 family transposase [Bacteroidota bacterium]
MNISQMRRKLSTDSIVDIAARFRFNLRRDAKVSFLSFLGGFFLSMHRGHSLKEWASCISRFLADGISLSKAGLQKRFNRRSLNCVKSFLKEQIRSRVRPLQLRSQSKGWFGSFRQVLIEDSVCVSLNAQLYKAFRGSHSRKSASGQSATARIQLCLNLKTLVYTRFALKSYRDNDQKYSSEIISLLRAGDLVIRDLGYAVLSVFEQIMKKEAFFLSRYKLPLNLYQVQDKTKIELAAYLAKADQKGKSFVDQPVLVGAKERLPLRLVAIKCSPEVAESRIRKAQKDRNKKANHNDAYYELLKWSLFITNVPPKTWTPAQILTIYGFRWHIEMVFKVWKSKFGLQTLMTKAQIIKPIHAQLFFYLFLAYLLLFYARYFHFFFEKLIKQQRVLSLFEFARFLQLHFLDLIQKETQGELDDFLPELAQYYCSPIRKNRPTQLEQLFCELNI